MSLIRNARLKTNQTLTIKKFLSEMSVGSNTINGNTYYYYPKDWCGTNNYYFKEEGQGSDGHIGFNAGSTIVIKCELAADAVGPIFGVTGKARIVCEGGNIKWYDDSNSAVHSAAIPTGVHNIGVYVDNAKLKPYFDGKVTDTSDAKAMTTRADERDFYPCALSTDAINGAQTGGCLYSTTATYAIKIYEMAGMFVTKASGSQQIQFMHFYATSQGNTTAPFFYETRSNKA